MQMHCTCVVFVCTMRTVLTRQSSSLSRPCVWLLTMTKLALHAEWVIQYIIVFKVWLKSGVNSQQLTIIFHFVVLVVFNVVLCIIFQNAKALKAKKEEGNKAFKDGNFEAAYDLYSDALTIDPNNIKTNAKLYCNRATVGSKVCNVYRRDARVLSFTFYRLSLFVILIVALYIPLNWTKGDTLWQT